MEPSVDPTNACDETSFIEVCRVQAEQDGVPPMDTGTLQEIYSYNQAVSEGREAYKQGLPRGANPYEPDDNVFYLGWDAGWSPSDT